MKLYIDKENLQSLVKSKADDAFEGCVRLLKQQMDVQYNFPKDEMLKDEYIAFWLNKLGDGVKTSHDYCPPKEVVPNREDLKSNFYKEYDKDGLSSVYLLNDEHVCDLVSAKGCILIGKIGEEISVLKELIIEDSEVAAIKINDWKSYCPHLPLTDIIINDNHYFKNKYVYERNDNELIRVLASVPNNSPVNVIIIVKEGEIALDIDLQAEQTKIKSVVKNVSGSSKSTVTILTTNKNHDRCLITNYYRIKHGSSFHLKENGVKNDVMTEIKSSAYSKNEENTSYLLHQFQTIADAPVQCYGDKKSNFLNFPEPVQIDCTEYL